MKESELQVLKHSALFRGIEEKEIASMLACLAARRKKYGKGEYIYNAGDRVSSVGLVLSGRVTVEKEDYWGNRNIVAAMEPGMLFAESYACAADVPIGVSVAADADSEILTMDIGKILTTCSSACTFHNSLIRNMVSLLASKNLLMNEKLTFITQRSTRKKLLSYLSAESVRSGSADFTIPFDRQELADYLSVDRSAMSSELSKMREEGILTFRKNRFTLLKKDEIL